MYTNSNNYLPCLGRTKWVYWYSIKTGVLQNLNKSDLLTSLIVKTETCIASVSNLIVIFLQNYFIKIF